MSHYRTRPPLVEGRQFTGGKKQFKKLYKWLKTYGHTLSWVPGDVESPERLILTKEDGEGWPVALDEWIVLRHIPSQPDGYLRTRARAEVSTFTNVAFHKQYELYEKTEDD